MDLWAGKSYSIPRLESDRDVDYESLPISSSYAKKYMKKLGIRVVVVKK